MQGLQQQLATRFRKERERLRLSTTDVAHYCGVSVSSIFSWEAARSRIPLSAVACLWDYGFDIEAVVGGSEVLLSVPLLTEGENLDNAKQECFVPNHKLMRYRLSLPSAFAYHNQALAYDLAASGDILVMRLMENDDVANAGEETVILFRPQNTKLSDFLCKVRTAGRGRLVIVSDSTSVTVGSRLFLENGTVLGEYCYRLGCRPADGKAHRTHVLRLAAFLESIGATSR